MQDTYVSKAYYAIQSRVQQLRTCRHSHESHTFRPTALSMVLTSRKLPTRPVYNLACALRFHRPNNLTVVRNASDNFHLAAFHFTYIPRRCGATPSSFRKRSLSRAAAERPSWSSSIATPDRYAVALAEQLVWSILIDLNSHKRNHSISFWWLLLVHISRYRPFPSSCDDTRCRIGLEEV